MADDYFNRQGIDLILIEGNLYLKYKRDAVIMKLDACRSINRLMSSYGTRNAFRHTKPEYLYQQNKILERKIYEQQTKLLEGIIVTSNYGYQMITIIILLIHHQFTKVPETIKIICLKKKFQKNQKTKT
ncbi:putative orfan [Tupanvirus soda lake]|uniref:Orfan n=2 Tax=Tupanvirus TaxID=2094720 RepID=A0AC62AAR4_9VIRU|nr:putative orfan [Tupanvirus soda lake]QKU34782.1 putative orfan [Tupanvirus soda lake]